MSIYNKASLVQIPSGYKASTAKLYSVVPNSTEGDFTVSSVADATRINEEGLIEKVSANQARLSRNFINGELQPDPFLLLEPTRTNYALDSSDISVWTNTTSGGSITSTANYATSPDGSSNATRLQMTATSYAMKNESTTSIVGDYSATIYLKSNTGSDQEIAIYGRNTPVTSYTVTSQWQRFEINGSATSGQASYINFGVNIGAGSDATLDVLAWGGQIEAGSYATSLIPTTTATVTRTQDSCKIQPFSGLATDYPITVYGKIEIQEKFASFISIGNSTNEFKYLSVSTGTGGVNVVRRNTPNDTDFYTFSYSIGDIIKFAIKYTSNTAYKLYINGSLIGNVTSGDDVDFDFDSVLLGQLRNSDTLRNSVYEAMIFNEALSDSELEALTS